MGNASSQRKSIRVVMLGLDAVGKTTMVYRIRLGDDVTTIPTYCCSVETVEYQNMILSVWDVGRQEKLRKLWRHFFDGCDGIVFVVDSADRDRTDECREELEKLLAEDALRSLPLLVFANKQDLPNAMTVEEVSDVLRLDTETSRRLWHVHPSTALNGQGLFEGLTWLDEAVETGFLEHPLIVTVNVVLGSGTELQQVSFMNVGGAELAVLSCSEAAQQTFGDVQGEIAERVQVERGRVQFVLPSGDVVSATSTTPVSAVLMPQSSGRGALCLVA